MDVRRQISKIELEAHRGEYGAWRKDYCKSYRATADRFCRQALLEARAYLDSQGSVASCRKGCAYCCVQYISISLGHGLVIVDYIYNNPFLLEPFLRRYEKWRDVTSDNVALQNLERYTTLSPVVCRTPQNLLDEYAKLEVSCPFLAQDACTIYPVRPICCASHMSVSPPERCRASSILQPLICEATPSPAGLRELAALAEPVMSLHQETLPSLVFRLLTEGLPEVMRKLEKLAGGEPG